MTPDQITQLEKLLKDVDSLKRLVELHTHTGIDGTTKFTASTVYGGSVSSTGSALAPFPSGWTCSKTGTGIYLVTHNLGTANYSVVVLPINLHASSDNVCGTMYAHDATSFTIEFVQSNLPATYINTDFDFILVRA